DGHIDAKERSIIEQNMREAGISEQGERLVQQAIDQPLDPQLLARDIQNEEEALELYFLSCAVIDVDHFMERSYLAALGDALKIPQDVRDGIEQDIREKKRSITD
ncbi:TPA: tellurite resistance TerB family protein, partial [Yersinia enterocolitica]